MPQTPPTQVEVALAAVQRWPQEPQLLTSVAILKQAPPQQISSDPQVVPSG
jgi:hypothetical protein